MKNRIATLSACLCLSLAALAQHGGPPPPPENITPGDNLVIENIPPVSTKLADQTERYSEFRNATLYGWHPSTRSMLIGTRFGDTTQVHSVAMPGGERKQLTFYPDRVSGASYLPDGKAFIFRKDTGGGEWFQLYRYDLADGSVTLLRSQCARLRGLRQDLPQARQWLPPR